MSAAEEDQVVEEVFSLAVSRDNAEDTAAQAETAAKYKEEGNQHFRNQQFEDAERSYSRCVYLTILKCLSHKRVTRAIQTCPAEFVEDLAVYLGNRAACYASMGEHALVIDDCSAALEKKPDYGKVLVRRSQAFEKLDKIDEALAGMCLLIHSTWYKSCFTDAKQAYALDPAAFPKLPATMYVLS